MNLLSKLREPAAALGLWATILILCIAWTQTDDQPTDEVAASQSADLRLCQERFGQNVASVELPNGDTVCTDKRGRRLRNPVVVAEKVAR